MAKTSKRRSQRREAHRTDRYRPMRKGDTVVRLRHYRRRFTHLYGAIGRIVSIDYEAPRAALVEWEDLGVQQLCYTSDLRRVRG